MMLDWQCPYPSNRSPIFAKNIVSTSQPLATESGISALRAGGNAVDAAIATAITLTVVEPNNNGIGSDAFAIIWDGNKLHGLNASGKSPEAWHPERFKKHDAMPQLGWDAVTVPGAVSAWVEMSEKFGVLPFEDLFSTAIHYAEKGFLVGPKTGYYWQYAEKRFHHPEFSSFRETFLPNGKAPPIGSLICLPDHATSLMKIAESKGESFYQGELAEAMVRESDQSGGVLSLDDLGLHRADWVDTLSQNLGAAALHEIPPNGQGLLALIAVGIVERFDLQQYPLDSVDAFHISIEATRLAFAIVERELADIQSMKIRPEDLISNDYLDRCASSIDQKAAKLLPTAIGTSEDTVYLSCADESGMMVSMIQSNYRGFGSGIVVPGTGISLQNRGNGFSLEKGHPNEVAGGKRPYHTIIPGFAMQNNRPAMSFGVMGGHMQAQGHLQMMIRVFLHQQNPQAASDAPRWYLQEDGILCLEKGFQPSVIQGLLDRGHQIKHDNPEHIFGGAQLICRLEDGYVAGSDHRKEGLASGF
ncbi:MAG: gamma-glutamyltransferase family protein [Pseudomonadales bacterium]|nr:gamma-glutamyltransferase family protein [Pseudomonadales bacterium]